MRREAKAPAVISSVAVGQTHAGRTKVHSEGRTLIAASTPVSSPARAISRTDHAFLRTCRQFSTGFNHISSVFDMNKLDTKGDLFFCQLSTTGTTASSILYIQVSCDALLDDHQVDRRSGVQGDKDIPSALHEVGRSYALGPRSNEVGVFTHPAPAEAWSDRSAAPQSSPQP